MAYTREQLIKMGAKPVQKGYTREQLIQMGAKPTSTTGAVPSQRNYANPSPPVVAPMPSVGSRAAATFNRVGDITGKVLGKVADIGFGSTGKVVGGTLTAGLGGVKTLYGQATKNPALVQEGLRLQNIGTKAQTPLAIAGATLETVPGAGIAIEKAAAKVGSKFSAPLLARAERLYQSALKPSSKLLESGVVKTGLEEGIRVSKGGLQKTQNLIESIGDDIGRVIEAGVASGKAIPKKNLLPYLDELKNYLGNSLGGKEMVKEVDVIAKSILKDLPQNIPVETAQKIKVTTGQLIKKYYDKLAPIQFETKKQLTRGLKEEIAAAVPEIKALNARDSKLIGLEEALGKAVGRIGNRELIGLTDVMAVGAGLATGGGAGAAAAAVTARRLFDNPIIKSQRAIIYNHIAKNAAKLIQAGRIPAGIAAARILELFDPRKE